MLTKSRGHKINCLPLKQHESILICICSSSGYQGTTNSSPSPTSGKLLPSLLCCLSFVTTFKCQDYYHASGLEPFLHKANNLTQNNSSKYQLSRTFLWLGPVSLFTLSTWRAHKQSQSHISHTKLQLPIPTS